MFGVELLQIVQCCMRNDVTAARSKFIVDGHSLIGCCFSWKEVKQYNKVVESGVQRASSRSDCVDLCTVRRSSMTSDGDVSSVLGCEPQIVRFARFIAN